MKQKVIVEPSKVWGYYQSDRDKFKSSMFEIASNEEYGVSIYLSETNSGNPCIVVEADDTEVYTENIISDTDCENTVSRIYDKYLTDKVVEILADSCFSADELLLEQEDAILEREDELDTLMYEFVRVAVGNDDLYLDGVYADEIFDDLKEHFLEYMARKYGIPIYRPMILEDENGEDFFEEYPYEYIVYDEPNGIGKEKSTS